MVRAKFRVQSRRQQFIAEGVPPQEVIELLPVSDEANKSWSQYTPSGKIELHITNPAASGQFDLGKFFYVDFVEAPAVEPKPAG